ncbi:MAG: hypothetical protein RLY66_166 [Candidatus Parcubacteria bacterium]|jgi:hypothetical protein
MKNYLKNIMIGTLAVLVMASPLVSFAKNDNNNGKGKGSENSKKEQSLNNDKKQSNDDHDDDQKKESKKNDDKKPNVASLSCTRAYGHLFAFGWFKKNSISDEERAYIAANCRLPFGIGKKFHGNNASTTPDVIAPVITDVASTAGKVQADIRWITNEYADSVVFWGTSSSVDTSDSANKTTNTHLTKNHQVVLKNLTSDTTYYFVVRSKDVAGNQSLSGTNSFKTKVASTTDTQAPAISGVATMVSTSTITVGWNTNENTTDRVYYSTSLPVTPNASTTSYVSNASTTKVHSVQITGLAANTTYYIVIESTDGAGNVSTSATFSAKTNALPVVVDTTAPILSSIASVTGASTSTISWITDEVSTSKVFYSTSTPLDITSSTTQSVLNGGLVTSHSIDLTGLATSTTYYFKIQSVDTSGNTATSSEFNTTTLAQ